MSNSIPPSPFPFDLQALLSAFDSSGQSAAAFARSKGLPAWKMYGALQRRSGKVRARRCAARLQSSDLLAVQLVDPKPVTQPAALELLLAGGHRLLIASDFDVPTLRRLLGALAQC